MNAVEGREEVVRTHILEWPVRGHSNTSTRRSGSTDNKGRSGHGRSATRESKHSRGSIKTQHKKAEMNGTWLETERAPHNRPTKGHMR